MEKINKLRKEVCRLKGLKEIAEGITNVCKSETPIQNLLQAKTNLDEALEKYYEAVMAQLKSTTPSLWLTYRNLSKEDVKQKLLTDLNPSDRELEVRRYTRAVA